VDSVAGEVSRKDVPTAEVGGAGWWVGGRLRIAQDRGLLVLADYTKITQTYNKFK
jgi:hypothetical protein